MEVIDVVGPTTMCRQLLYSACKTCKIPVQIIHLNLFSKLLAAWLLVSSVMLSVTKKYYHVTTQTADVRVTEGYSLATAIRYLVQQSSRPALSRQQMVVTSERISKCSTIHFCCTLCCAASEIPRYRVHCTIDNGRQQRYNIALIV